MDRHVAPAFDKLAKTIGDWDNPSFAKLATSIPALDEDSKSRFFALETLMFLAHKLGKYDMQWKAPRMQTAYARSERAGSPEEIALRAAIKAERGKGPVARPTKEATAILLDVNKRLRAGGFDEVKLDKVRRRLEDRKIFPRS